MSLLCSIQLVDVILLTLSNGLIVLEPLIYTRVLSLLCISYHPKIFILFCSHPTHYFVSLIVEVIIDFSIHVSKYWYTLTIFSILVFYIFPHYLEYYTRNYKTKKLTKHLKATAHVLGLHHGSNLNQFSSMNKKIRNVVFMPPDAICLVSIKFFWVSYFGTFSLFPKHFDKLKEREK